MIAVRGLQLDDERRRVFKQRQHLVKQRDALVGALEAVVFQLLACQILALHVRACRPQEARIVDDGQRAVSRV